MPPNLTQAQAIIAECHASLASGGTEEAIRYETQATSASMTACALINLATKIHPGMPLGNSYLIHELAEAKAWQALGHDFSSRKLLKLSHAQRAELSDAKTLLYEQDFGPHLEGIRAQYRYLQAVAVVRGFSISPGTLFEFNPVIPVKEVERVRGLTDEYETVSDEVPHAVAFYAAMRSDEPEWFALFQDLHERGRIRRFFEVVGNSHGAA